LRFNYQFSYLLCQARFSSSSDMLSICTIAADIEDPVFNKIIRCDYVVLQSYLSDRPEVLCNLRERHHNKTSFNSQKC